MGSNDQKKSKQGESDATDHYDGDLGSHPSNTANSKSNPPPPYYVAQVRLTYKVSDFLEKLKGCNKITFLGNESPERYQFNAEKPHGVREQIDVHEDILNKIKKNKSFKFETGKTYQFQIIERPLRSTKINFFEAIDQSQSRPRSKGRT